MEYLFPNCDESINCHGCHGEFDETSVFTTQDGNFDAKSVVIYNKDVFTNERKHFKPQEGKKYYEMFSTYENDKLLDKATHYCVPSSHNISVYQTKSLDKMTNRASCFACGGVSFVIFKVKGNNRIPVCYHGWKGSSDDGWINNF